MWCVVLVLCVYMWCCAYVCGETWHAENPRVYVQNASVCTVRTSPCVPATGPHVFDMRACCRYTRRRPDRTHGGVLNVHTGGFSLLSSPLSFSLSVALSRSFFPLLFSCLVSPLTCLFFFLFLLLFSFPFSFSLFLSLFHCTHRDEIRQTSDSTN